MPGPPHIPALAGPWASHEAGGHAADPIRGHETPAVRSGDKDYSRYIRPRLEDQRFAQERLVFSRKGGSSRRFLKKGAPDPFAGTIANHQPTKNAAHTMTHKDDRAVV